MRCGDASNADGGSRHLCRRPLGFHDGAGRLPCRLNRITYLNVLVLDHFARCQDFFSREPDQFEVIDDLARVRGRQKSAIIWSSSSRRATRAGIVA